MQPGVQATRGSGGSHSALRAGDRMGQPSDVCLPTLLSTGGLADFVPRQLPFKEVCERERPKESGLTCFQCGSAMLYWTRFCDSTCVVDAVNGQLYFSFMSETKGASNAR